MTEAPLIVITGPTGSGKGSAAFELAQRVGGEVVSLDSMKVYREMDIGTAKPSAERRGAVPHHLLDLVDPDRDFSTGDFLPLLARTLEEITGRGRRPVLCGGTALYLVGFLKGLSDLPSADWEVRRRLHEEAERDGPEALHRRLAEVDPAAAERIRPRDLRRIVRALEVFESTGRRLSEQWDWGGSVVVPTRSSTRLFGLAWERSELYARTDQRVLAMVERGLLAEAAALAQRDPPLSRSAAQCIGYKEVFEGRETGATDAEIIERIQRNTRRLVKKQLTWFRKQPVEWVPVDATSTAAGVAEEILRRAAEPPPERTDVPV